MARLFLRDYALTVDTIAISGLTISFAVQKSVKREPNTCELKITNLSPSHRAQIEALSTSTKKKPAAGGSAGGPAGKGKIRVALEAGYKDSRGLIFEGDLRTATTERNGPDRVTTISGDDGGRAMLWARVNQSFPPGTAVSSVARACAAAMGVGIGNAIEAMENVRLIGGAAVFAEGTVISGSAATEMEHILRSVGLRYSMQNGVLQVLQRGKALQTTAVLLNGQTGLIQNPGKQADGTIAARCLLNADIYPGRQIKFETDDMAGFYRAERVKYTGDTFGDDWHCDLELKELVPVTN